MKKYLQKKLNNEKGMTLIELLAVIVIIAIIAAIAIPAIGNIIQNSRIDAIKSDALNVLSAASLYEAQEGEIPTAGVAISELVSNGFLEDAGNIPATDKDTTSLVLPGPLLDTKVPDVIGTKGIIFDEASVQHVNNADSSSEIRQTLEGGTDATIDATP